MTDFENWARKAETKARLASAKKNAWEQFTKQFPNADKNQFQVQTSVDEKYRISAEVFFNESEGSSVSVFGSDRKYWSQKMKTALGLAGLEGFPYQLSPLKTKTALSNMIYWPQQLNFATFCATQGCGISREIIDEGMSLTPQIRAFYQFHVLYQMGGIQSMSALPGDPTFNPLNNRYDVASYKRICAEFGIDPSSYFRFTRGKNHGLGRVNGEMQLDFKYPDWMKFSDEGGDASKGNRISYIRPDEIATGSRQKKQQA